MQVHIPVKGIKNLRCILLQKQSVEETQQLRIPEPMSDVDRILGAWGQVLLRGKEWRDGCVTVTGGTMVWVMYLPEGETQTPQTAQAWLPFQMKWDLPQTPTDGKIRVQPLLESVDARSTSAKKIVARATVSVLLEAYLEEERECFVLEELPEDLCVLKKTYPLLLPRECGEKVFEMEEDLTLPQSAPPIGEILRFSFHPELIDQKVMSGKVVFRGSGLLHVLYKSEDNELNTWDFEIPFAQYEQLETEYEQDAKCRVLPVVTGLELDQRPNGELRLKAGITGQYLIYDITELTVAEDAYRIHGDLAVQHQDLELPVVLDMKQQTIPAEISLPTQVTGMLDVAFYPSQICSRTYADGMILDLSGSIHVLYLDENHQIQGKTQRWQEEMMIPAASNTQIYTDLQASGVPKATITSADTVVKSGVYLDCLTGTQSTILMISKMETGEEHVQDPERPCLVLQRMCSSSLWDLAKENGSTVEKICAVNGLTDTAEFGQMLLIPIL